MTARDLFDSAFGPNCNLYKIVLNLSTTEPTAKQIRKAYHKRALEFHPDKQQTKSETEQEIAKLKFQAVSFAYEILSKEETRKAYDEHGEIYDDEDIDFQSDAGVEQWKNVFSKMFGKVTTADIDSFEQTYKHSEEERLDVLKYYKICKGNFDKMLTCVMLSEEDDIPRWKTDFLEPAISKGDIERWHQTTESNKRMKQSNSMEEANSEEDTVTESDDDNDTDTDTPSTSTNSKARANSKAKAKAKAKAPPKSKTKSTAKRSKQSKKEKEAKEAEELMAKMRQNALARRGNASSFGSLLSSLESRYATESSSKSKSKSKTKSQAEPPDIPDDEFDRIQARLNNAKQSNSKKR